MNKYPIPAARVLIRGKRKYRTPIAFPIKTFPVHNFKSTRKQNCFNAGAKQTAYKLLKNLDNKLES